MPFALFSCFALPLWCVFFALYFILRKRGLLRQSLLAKCGGSFLSAASAGFAFYVDGQNPLAQSAFWFFILCTLADALLEIHFITGVVVFGAAHVCLSAWLWGLGGFSWWNGLIWAAAMGAALLLFRKELPGMGWMALPCSLYVGILSASLALALPLPFLRGAGCWTAALAAASFFVSDMMVAKSQLGNLGDRRQKPIMALYWAALYLFSAAIW